jgi:hypothetical protein
MGEAKICAPQEFFSNKIALKLKQVDFLKKIAMIK